MPLLGADQRIVAGAAATLVWREFDQHGEPTVNGGTAPTVAVVRADGTAVSSGTATNATTYWSWALTAAQTERVDTLTVTWTIGTVDVTTTVAVVGGVVASIATARALEPEMPQIADEALYVARGAAEDELERITRRAWVSRANRVEIPSVERPTLVMPDWDLRSVRKVETIDTAGTATEYTGTVRVDSAGLLHRVDGTCWPCSGTVRVEYLHHADLPHDLVAMFARRWRWWCNQAKSAVPGRALSFTLEQGGAFRLAAPGEYTTGDVEVDGTYGRHTRREYGIA